MRILDASFKKIAEKLDGLVSKDKTKRQDFGGRKGNWKVHAPDSYDKISADKGFIRPILLRSKEKR